MCIIIYSWFRARKRACAITVGSACKSKASCAACVLLDGRALSVRHQPVHAEAARASLMAPAQVSWILFYHSEDNCYLTLFMFFFSWFKTRKLSFMPSIQSVVLHEIIIMIRCLGINETV